MSDNIPALSIEDFRAGLPALGVLAERFAGYNFVAAIEQAADRCRKDIAECEAASEAYEALNNRYRELQELKQTFAAKLETTTKADYTALTLSDTSTFDEQVTRYQQGQQTLGYIRGLIEFTRDYALPRGLLGKIDAELAVHNSGSQLLGLKTAEAAVRRNEAARVLESVDGAAFFSTEGKAFTFLQQTLDCFRLAANTWSARADLIKRLEAA